MNEKVVSPHSGFRDKVARLEQVGTDETTIVRILESTHQRVRRAMQNPTEQLPQGAREEIYFDDSDRTNAQLAKAYATTESRIGNAKQKLRRTQEKVRPPRREVERVFTRLGNARDTAVYLGASLAYVYDTLDLRRDKAKQEAVLTLLARGMTHQAIADTLDVPRSTVTAANIRHNETRQNQRIKNWPEILRYAEEHNVTAASLLYGVTRANIYYHMRKKHV